MRIICVSHVRRKLKLLALTASLWIMLFLFGSYLISSRLQISISVGSFAEFSYPYGIVADKIISQDAYSDRTVFTSPLPPSIRTEPFINYESLEEKFSFKYPSAFEIKQAAFTGGDILYHLDFHDRNGSSHGFLQVWSLPGDLVGFLDKSTETAHQTYRYFKSGEIEINNVKGVAWDYAVLTGNGYYKGMEVFLKQDERMYRLSYFLPEEKWDEKQADIFWNMAESIKIKR